MNGRVVVLVTVLLAVGAAAALWWLNERLSSDAIGMAIGLAIGTLAGLPVAALVNAAARRDAEDDWQSFIVDYPLPPMAASSPQLSDRQAEIDTLRSALDYLEGEAQ